MNCSFDERITRIFKERYKVEPSILYLENEKIDKEKIEKFLNKSYLIYVNKEVIDHKIVEVDRLVEYDSSGILIYIKGGVYIFIFTTADRLNVAEFTLHNLIKLNK
jgi:hypothetical protein